jgi:hypothetical protein
MDSQEPQTSRFGPVRRIKDGVRQTPAVLYSILELPGLVQPIDYADVVTGDRVRIQVGKRYTVIAVNRREYWFRRLTGAFDGTGYACSDARVESLDCMLADIHESTHPLSLWGIKTSSVSGMLTR